MKPEEQDMDQLFNVLRAMARAETHAEIARECMLRARVEIEGVLNSTDDQGIRAGLNAARHRIDNVLILLGGSL